MLWRIAFENVVDYNSNGTHVPSISPELIQYPAMYRSQWMLPGEEHQSMKGQKMDREFYLANFSNIFSDIMKSIGWSITLEYRLNVSFSLDQNECERKYISKISGDHSAFLFINIFFFN